MALFFMYIEMLVALTLAYLLYKKLHKMFLTESIKQKVEDINIVNESNDKLAEKIEPISKQQKTNKRKINSFIDEGDKLNG